jgi:hypothetical protein
MTGHVIRDDGRSGHSGIPWLGSYRLSSVESRLLGEALRHFQVFTEGQLPPDVARQGLLAQIVAEKSLAHAAPGLNRLTEKVRNEQARSEKERNEHLDCVFVTNLPTDRMISGLLALTLASAIGRVFSYGPPHGGRLVMEVASGEPHRPRGELNWRTEGAWLPSERRAEWIGLLGVENTPGCHVDYAPIGPVEPTLSAQAKDWLRGQSACFRPSDTGPWSAPRAILSRSPLSHTEIAWPGGAIRSATAGDTVWAAALEQLAFEFDRQHVKVPIEAGSFVAFNNLRGVHRLEMAADGDDLLYKTYSRRSLRALQAKGEAGPVFSLTEADVSRQACSTVA